MVLKQKNLKVFIIKLAALINSPLLVYTILIFFTKTYVTVILEVTSTSHNAFCVYYNKYNIDLDNYRILHKLLFLVII